MNTPNLDGISVLVDGGCLNNNKPMSERSMYGSLTVFCGERQVKSTYEDKKQLIHRRSYDTLHTKQDASANISNNQAELETMLDGLLYVDELQKRMAEQDKEPVTVTVLCDSQFAVGLASRAAKLNKKSHRDLHDTLNLIHAELGNVDVVFQHVDNRWVKSVLGH